MSWFGSHRRESVLPTVTGGAAQYVLDVLQRHNIPADVAARVRADASGLQVKMDQAQPGDATIAHGGRTIILLDPQTAQSLAGHAIDVQQTAGGPELVVRAPGGHWTS